MNVAIIGATSGIGRRLWEHYSSGHNMVAVMGRRVELLEEMAASRRENTLTYACDISPMFPEARNSVFVLPGPY